MPKRIPESTIQTLKANIDIVELIGRYVNYSKHSGQNYFALCPFHSEKTPSFSVNKNKQIYHCFGCHKGGDAIGFIMDMEHLSYPEAIIFLGELYGITIEYEGEDNEFEREKRQERERLIELNTEAARYFYRALNSAAGKEAREYLLKRQISPTLAKKFGLGFAPDKWQGLYEHIKRKGYTELEIKDSGLFRVNKNGNFYDLFRNRLIFPIFDALGKIVAFGGRVLDDSLPKYLNSPETKLYTKGMHLYGLNIAKKSKAQELLVVEGYMDCISLHQAGFDQAVASLGTALTSAQAALLRKYKNGAILAYDMDAAGREATLRNIEVTKEKNLDIRVLILPTGKDPDEFLRTHTKGDLKQLLLEAPDALEYRFIDAKLKSTEEGELNKVLYQDKATDILLDINNAVVRELYIATVAQELNVSEKSILQVLELKKQAQRNSGFKKYRQNRAASLNQQNYKKNAVTDRSTKASPNKENSAHSASALKQKSLPQATKNSSNSNEEYRGTEKPYITALEVSVLNKLTSYYALYKEVPVKLESKYFTDKQVRAFVEQYINLIHTGELDMESFFNLINKQEQPLRDFLNEKFTASLINTSESSAMESAKDSLIYDFKNLQFEYYTRISNYISKQMDLTTDQKEKEKLKAKYLEIREQWDTLAKERRNL